MLMFNEIWIRGILIKYFNVIVIMVMYIFFIRKLFIRIRSINLIWSCVIISVYFILIDKFIKINILIISWYILLLLFLIICYF